MGLREGESLPGLDLPRTISAGFFELQWRIGTGVLPLKIRSKAIDVRLVPGAMLSRCKTFLV